LINPNDDFTQILQNIDIGEVYAQNAIDADIHYEHLEKLADFFGRNMSVHHHDRFYQIHLILSGTVRVHLDETSYSTSGPMFFLTPPTVPHSFVTENNANGHVITARQQLVWELLGGLEQHLWNHDSFMKSPVCVKISPEKDPVASRLLTLFSLMADESARLGQQSDRALKAILQLILIDISRLSRQHQPQKKTGKEDVRIFHKFNELIEANYTTHRPLSFYAEKIGVTVARLNEICRRLAGLSSKSLITDRIMQEARRLLHFSSISVTEIGYTLGFKDPAYFARYFRTNALITASQYRHNSRN
jgi:AraC family 4-hydroxyphenylacetate 3-monooxygenase operon regulatory protein